MMSWLFKGRSNNTPALEIVKKSGMRWIPIYIPEQLANSIGHTSIKAGVTKINAIGAALWFFSKLTIEEKKLLIQSYLDRNYDDVDPGSNHHSLD